jgi:hypothetical protein
MRTTLCLLLLASAACRDGKPPPPEVAARRAPPGLPPLQPGESAPATPAEADRPTPSEPPGPGEALSGTLLERIDAPPYSYLRIETAGGEAWAAVNQAAVEKGARITVTGNVMEGFESKTLGRRFERIVFGVLGDGAAAPAPAPRAGGVNERVATAPASDVEVEPAAGPGGTTIAALHAGKAGLAGRAVAVRGKVVKLNGGILGKTWIHLQDGSGAATAGDHDLAATTTDPVKLGDVVTVRGTLHLDRDFGAGYRYGVIVEDARVGP